MRPDKLETIVGQETAKAAIQLALDGAKASGRALPHMLFTGKPGTGKTTMARAVAGERGTKCYDMVASSIISEVMLMNMVMNLEEGDVLFIDEIHDLPEKYGDILYTVLEDFKLSMTLGYHNVNMPVPYFTFIGATNRPDELQSAFRDRFGLLVTLEEYTGDEMAQIAQMNSDVPLEDRAACMIATAGRGIPRVTVRYVDRVMDYARKHNLKKVEMIDVQEVFKILKVNEYGLTPTDMRVLKAMMIVFSGKPAGVKAIASAIGETQKTLEEQIEPFLIRNQYITRLPNGRVLTEHGLHVLKVTKALQTKEL